MSHLRLILIILSFLSLALPAIANGPVADPRSEIEWTRTEPPTGTQQLPDLNGTDVWQIERSEASQDVRIEGGMRDGVPVEILYLPGQEILELTTPVEHVELRDTQLTSEQIELAREDAREVLELTLKAALSENFSGNAAVTDGAEALTLQPQNTQSRLAISNFFRTLFFENDRGTQGLTRRVSEKFKASIRNIWQFVFVETVKAGADYYRQFNQNRSRFTEFGIALDIKLEPQIFISKFNPTQKIKLFSRSYALFLEISYSRSEKRALVKTRYRREKGTGGLGLPALKAEFKFFESDGTRGTYRGKSWYPVSPPLVSFVLDSSSHYFAQGITVGINSGDLVPGSTLTNTFTEFVQTENTKQLAEIPRRANNRLIRQLEQTLPQVLRPPVRPALRSCRALF